MNAPKKKLLIIAYHFPPDAAVGALRPQKFAKYLSEFGWTPYVLTIREKFAERLDPGRLTDVAQVSIVRTDFWRSPLSFFLEIRGRLKKGKTQGETNLVSKREDHAGSPQKKSFGEKFKHYLWEINTFPDASFYWSFPAFTAGFRLIRREQIDCIYATIPQPTAALVGYFLANLTGTQLVLDFRDPWAGAWFPNQWRSGIYAKLEAWVEHLTIRRAYRVICTNDRFRQHLRRNYCDLSPEKFVTIPNGFDAEDNQTPSETTKNGRFVISYLGTFYLDRNPESFFAALRNGINDGSLPAQEIEVHLLGQVQFVGNISTQEMLNTYGLSNVVKIRGTVPHREALKQMLESDLLLLFAPNQPNQVPGKAFEYIGAQKPVLALTEEGATADLIRESQAGLVVTQDNPTEILKALREIIRYHRLGENPWYQGCDIRKYERRALTGQLATILNGAIGNQK